jgi:hypothetical protein
MKLERVFMFDCCMVLRGIGQRMTQVWSKFVLQIIT